LRQLLNLRIEALLFQPTYLIQKFCVVPAFFPNDFGIAVVVFCVWQKSKKDVPVKCKKSQLDSIKYFLLPGYLSDFYTLQKISS